MGSHEIRNRSKSGNGGDANTRLCVIWPAGGLVSCGP
jgi:hypothetical protein